MSAVSPIPEGCNTVNAYVVVKDAEQAMEFYVKAFQGTGGTCMRAPDGSVMHGEVRIGNSTLMFSQENPQWDMKSAETMGGSPVSMHLYVDDADATFQRAVDAGCTALHPVSEMFWGDRMGKLVDPFGLQWGIATHIEDVSEEEMKRRGEAFFKQTAESGACQEPAPSE